MKTHWKNHLVPKLYLKIAVWLTLDAYRRSNFTSYDFIKYIANKRKHY